MELRASGLKRGGGTRFVKGAIYRLELELQLELERKLVRMRDQQSEKEILRSHLYHETRATLHRKLLSF